MAKLKLEIDVNNFICYNYNKFGYVRKNYKV